MTFAEQARAVVHHLVVSAGPAGTVLTGHGIQYEFESLSKGELRCCRRWRRHRLLLFCLFARRFASRTSAHQKARLELPHCQFRGAHEPRIDPAGFRIAYDETE
jgi:hypothetical protein